MFCGALGVARLPRRRVSLWRLPSPFIPLPQDAQRMLWNERTQQWECPLALPVRLGWAKQPARCGRHRARVRGRPPNPRDWPRTPPSHPCPPRQPGEWAYVLHYRDAFKLHPDGDTAPATIRGATRNINRLAVGPPCAFALFYATGWPRCSLVYRAIAGPEDEARRATGGV